MSEPVLHLLLALSLVPEPEQDAAISTLLVATFSELLERDLVQARRRQEVTW